MDSFICYGGYLYLFQFTVSEKHKIKDDPISRFATCRDLPPRQNWIFIFIIPYSVETLKCSYPESPEFQGLSPCSSQVGMENSTTPVASLSINGGGEATSPQEPKVTETFAEGSTAKREGKTSNSHKRNGVGVVKRQGRQK